MSPLFYAALPVISNKFIYFYIFGLIVATIDYRKLLFILNFRKGKGKERNMTLYIYDLETLEVIDKIEGETNEMCEKIAAENWNIDDCGWTYTPAFGFNGGLI